jgi:hypothetical protein
MKQSLSDNGAYANLAVGKRKATLLQPTHEDFFPMIIEVCLSRIKRQIARNGQLCPAAKLGQEPFRNIWRKAQAVIPSDRYQPFS